MIGATEVGKRRSLAGRNARMTRWCRNGGPSCGYLDAIRWSVIFLLAGVTLETSSLSADERLQYNRDIRPILAENCFACHGPDSAARQADLRLDQFDAAVDMGAIDPGDAENSELIHRIESEDPDEQMPPPTTKKVVSDAQKRILRKWIEQGAEYEPHWSFIAPQRVDPPPVSEELQAWIRNPIDAFVVARLEQAGLKPSAEADRRTLARRLCLDLTGLPPRPDLVERFVHDPRPDAYEHLVDELLASPQWGEHRCRYWLDYARYADTHGIHFDNYREMWSYREWVIDAFNRNMPFDQFTRENLAGDLLPDATLAQKIASGFNRCNITTNEGGAIDEEYLVLYARDRTETTAQVWLGLTAGCAVCHHHKFDPLTQPEFYQLAAFFNNTSQAAMDGNIQDTPPIVRVPRPEDADRLDTIEPRLNHLADTMSDRKESARSEFDQWLASASPGDVLQRQPHQGLALHLPFQEGSGQIVQATVAGANRDVELAESAKWQDRDGGKALSVEGSTLTLDDVGDFERDQPFTCTVWIHVPANDSSSAIVARMNEDDGHRGWDLWIQQRRIAMHLIHHWSDDALKVVAEPQFPAGEWVHVAVVYDGTSTASGVHIYYNGKVQTAKAETDQLRNSIRTNAPFRVGRRHKQSAFIGSLHDVRIYEQALTDAEVLNLAQGSHLSSIVARAPDQRSDAERSELYDWWLLELDPSYREALTESKQLESERAGIHQRGTVAHVMHEKNEPAMAYVLVRGEYDRRGEAVQPNTPSALPPFPDSLPRNRLGLAEWLLMPGHPLTARVTVNRCWQELFGSGLVRTAGDFGVMGELPSHPELLDWLAVEFRESGWDLKRFYRLLVTSSTYRQSAAVEAERWQLDPDNRLWSRGPRFRMDAEMVRDYALAASGLLVDHIGGPSVRPYQPDGIWEAVAMIGSNTREYKRDAGEALYRRSMYTFWKRAAPPASLEIFNAPARETCTVRRERTNTPLQALATLNDIQFVEAARVLAARAIATFPQDDENAIDFIARRLMARPLRSAELEIVRQSLAKLRDEYRQQQVEAQALIAVGESPLGRDLDHAELAAWTMLTNQLMNLDEVLVK